MNCSPSWPPASPDEMNAELAEQIDLESLITDLGLESLAAVAASSVQDGDRFHNKAIVYTPQGRTGLLKMLGRSAEPFTTLKMAPADADLILERDLNLKAAIDIGRKIADRFPKGGASFADAMKQNMASMSMNVGDFLGRFDTRLLLIGRVDQDKKLQIPMLPVEVPELDLLIGLTNMPWLWEELKKQIPAEGQSPVEFTEGDGFEAFLAPDMLGNPRFRPQLYFDKASKMILIATSGDFIQTCLSPSTSIDTNPDFQLATAGLPTEGNALSYMSPEVMGLVYDLLESSVKVQSMMAGAEDPNATLGMEMIEMFLPKYPEGVAAVSVNLDDGILFASNSFESHKTTLFSTMNPTSLAVLASMGMPAYQKIQGRAETTKVQSNIRQLLIASRAYAADNDGNYPDNLEELVPDWIDEFSAMELMEDSRGGFPQPLDYNSGQTDSSTADTWLIASPPFDGKRLVGYVDGRVEEIPEFLFEEN